MYTCGAPSRAKRTIAFTQRQPTRRVVFDGDRCLELEGERHHKMGSALRTADIDKSILPRDKNLASPGARLVFGGGRAGCEIPAALKHFLEGFWPEHAVPVNLVVRQ